MGFRNPLTSLSGSDITPGTIIGSTIETAASGPRVIISAVLGGEIDLSTGDAQELTPGKMNASILGGGGAGDQGLLYLAPPQLGSGAALPATQLYAYGQSRDGTLPGGWHFGGEVDVNGIVKDETYLPPSQARGTASAYTGLLANGAQMLAIAFPAVPIPTRVTWDVLGNAGYPSAPTYLNVVATTVPAMTLIAGVAGYNVGNQAMYCDTSVFIPIAQGGAFLIPANTAVSFDFAARISVGPAAYFRVNVNWRRDYEA